MQGSETAEGITCDRAAALISKAGRPLKLVFGRGSSPAASACNAVPHATPPATSSAASVGTRPVKQPQDAQINKPARPLEIVFGRGAEKRSVTYQGVGLGVTLADAVRSARTCVRRELPRNSVRGSASLQRGAAPATPAVVCAGRLLWRDGARRAMAGGGAQRGRGWAVCRQLRAGRRPSAPDRAAHPASDGRSVRRSRLV